MSTVTTTARQNWVSGETHEVLAHIHESEVNIAIFNRSIGTLTEELNRLVQKDLEIKISGELEVILDRVDKDEALADCSLIKQDIQEQLRYFREVSQAKSYRLLLATVNTNMCRKFHTDLNDLRLLCTYSGPGTLWLREDNVNREAL
ncbi:MAG TPA: hypothetical protein DCE41_08930, partial [Cytophagales bacterium]|nr:hypothetical protein [Cytophagales bacterium]